MHQDVWVEVIQFLEPIDLLTSLLTLNRNVYEFICQSACLEFDNICKFCNGNLLGGVRISLIHHHNNEDDNLIIDNSRVKVIGNTKYIIRLYLLKLAKRMGNIYPSPDVKFEKEIGNILDSNELKLLNFYRSRLFPEFKHQKNGILSYLLIGDVAIGKTTLFHWIGTGKKQVYYGGAIGIDYCSKKFQIANEICCNHRIWDTARQERFYKRNALLIRFMRYVSTYVLCFSMLNQETFQYLDEWFAAIEEFKSQNISHLGIIVGLHSHNNNSNDYEHVDKVSIKDAVKKSYLLGKSVFVESDCVEETQMYASFWFLQLQYSYFHNYNDCNDESTTNSTKSWCSLL